MHNFTKLTILIAMTLMSIEDAQAHILANFSPLPKVTVPLLEAHGCVLSADIVAHDNLPPFDNSSMDGYAVRAADIASAAVKLQVIGDVPAGAMTTAPVMPGTAMRVMTGAPMPPGADAVIPVEDTDDENSVRGGPLPSAVVIKRSIKAGDYVRKAGGDIQAGSVVLRAGKLINTATLGVLGSLGYAQVPIYRRPRIGILASGDELVDVDQPLGPAQIRNVNGYTVQSLVEDYGGIAVPLGVARDTRADVRQKLQLALDQKVDLLVTSAGVSMGAADVMRQELEAHGEIQLWKVNMKPGKPVVFGHYQGLPWLGLPGNPVSTIVAFKVFARPILLAVRGLTDVSHPTVSATLAHAVKMNPRRTFMRARLYRDAAGQLIATSAGGQESHMLRSLAEANALVIVPEGENELPIGSRVEAWLLGQQ